MTNAVRPALELMRVEVRQRRLMNAANVSRFLAGADGDLTAPYLLIATHGSPGRLLVHPGGEGGLSLSSEDIAGMNLREKVVISIGCVSGAHGLPEAFIAAGARAYIAPSTPPFAHAAPVFVSMLFFLLTQGESLEPAVERTRRAHHELAPWVLFPASAV